MQSDEFDFWRSGGIAAPAAASLDGTRARSARTSADNACLTSMPNSLATVLRRPMPLHLACLTKKGHC